MEPAAPRALTAKDVELVRAALPDTHWDRLTPSERWKAVEVSSDGLSVLILLGTYSRDTSAGPFGSHAKDLPWHSEAYPLSLVLDRDRSRVLLCPDNMHHDRFFREHVASLARGRRLAELKRRKRGE